MHGRAVRTQKKDGRFFAALAAGAPVGEACRAAGYARRSVYEWRDADTEFAALWREAIEAAVELMEREADRRALEGTERPVFHRGATCGYVQEYSDTLLIFRLKALRPDKYRERFEHVGRDGKDLIPAETDRTKLALALLNVLRPGGAGAPDGVGDSAGPPAADIE